MHRTEDFIYQDNFELEPGGYLPGFQLRFTTYGQLNEKRDNVIWVCHALTANADFLDWWKGLFGSGKLYDPEKYFVVCANALGSCYGSTGPLSTNSISGKPFFHDFPQLTNRDIVRAFDLLRQHLGIELIHTVIGGSLGGQHALEWAIMRPDKIKHLVQLCSNAQHSPWGIAFNESQRMAIENDPSWTEDSPEAGLQGMRTARSIALLSYRHYQTYENSQLERDMDKLNAFKASSYQRYQGEKLARRFNAYSYWILSKAMDSHHVGRGRGSLKQALEKVQAHALFLGVSTDLLFPINEQEFLSRHVSRGQFAVINSAYGHDGFLIEIPRLEQEIGRFYNKVASPKTISQE